jgi:IPT/TIG domain
MSHAPANHSRSSSVPSLFKAIVEKVGRRKANWYMCFALLAAAVLVSPIILAQGTEVVTSVDPSSGKVNDSVTVTGENLGKESVSAVFLSDDKEDFKATIVEQSADKIVIKIPKVKSGSYNISVQVGDKILIKPIRFTVEE